MRSNPEGNMNVHVTSVASGLTRAMLDVKLIAIKDAIREKRMAHTILDGFSPVAFWAALSSIFRIQSLRLSPSERAAFSYHSLRSGSDLNVMRSDFGLGFFGATIAHIRANLRKPVKWGFYRDHACDNKGVHNNQRSTDAQKTRLPGVSRFVARGSGRTPEPRVFHWSKHMKKATGCGNTWWPYNA